MSKPHETPTPDYTIPMLTEAFHARRREDYAGAKALFMKVFAKDRTNPYVLVEMARLEAMRLDYAEMQKILAQAEELAGDDPEAWLEIAACCLEALQTGECVRVCQTAITSFPGNKPLLARRLEALERSNQVNVGLALLENSGPVTPECQIIGARLLRRSGAPEKALVMLSGNATPGGLMERARVLDSLGRPRNAVESLERAKALIRANPETAYERELAPKRREHLARIREAVTPSRVEGWTKEELGPKRPLAFLLGHPRSGTTLLETLLEKTGRAVIASEYPVLEQEIANWVRAREAPVAEEEERAVVFPLLTAAPKEVGSIRAGYWEKISRLAGAREGDWVVDKNPGLTDGVHWIARCWPEAKILVLLRDPRDVIVSCVYQDFGLSRLGVACLSWEGAARAWSDTMGHWLAMRENLAPERWREIRYEELVANPEATVAELTGFLGLAQPETGPSPMAERLIRTPSYADVARPVHQRAVGRWKAYGRWLTPLRGIIEPTMNRLGYRWE